MDDVVVNHTSEVWVTYHVYTILNHVTGWIYVGKTNQPSVRWRRHIRNTCNSHLRASMLKHGVENFELISIEEHETESVPIL